MILISTTSVITIQNDPMPQAIKKIEQLSGQKDLQPQSLTFTTIGPFQQFKVAFYQKNEKKITAKFTSWFGLTAGIKCYSESENKSCGA